jgi:hypothetical protein
VLAVTITAPPVLAGEVAPGEALLQPFKQQLMSALQSGLTAGPASAIEVCQLQAPAIASSLSTGGVAMGRSSHRLRNPDNVGPEWAMQVLEQYLATAAPAAPVTLPLAAGREGYVEPIYTQAICLTCHGQSLPPDLAQTLEQRYPQDQATGFSEGELRGIFWVEYPSEAARP